MITNAMVLANRLLDELVGLRAELRATSRPSGPASAASSPVVSAELAEALLRLQRGGPMTTGQVCQVAGCSATVLQRLVKQGEAQGIAAPRYRLGREWRWNGGDLQGWLAAVGGEAG